MRLKICLGNKWARNSSQMSMETLSQRRLAFFAKFILMAFFLPLILPPPWNHHWLNYHLTRVLHFITQQSCCHQTYLISSLITHFHLFFSFPPSCVWDRLYGRLCAEGRDQVRRGFRSSAWTVLCRTTWRPMLSSTWATPSWVGEAARWASDLQAAVCDLWSWQCCAGNF